MNVQKAGTPSSSVPRWQATIAALSLVLLSVVVIFPLGGTLLALWGGVLAVASAWSLDAIGARDTHVVQGAVGMAVGLLGFAASVTLVGAAASGIRKLGVGRKTGAQAYGVPAVSTPNQPTSWWSKMLEHPWLSLGGFALFIDGCVVPFQASHVIGLPPEVLGGFIITGATLLFLFALVLSLRAYAYWMRMLWAGVRQSGFFAGLVTAGSLVAATIVLLVGHAFGQVASALSAQETTRALETCSSPADCSRRVFESALGEKSRNLAPLPAEQFTPEERSSFQRCVEELHRKDANGTSPRERAFWVARLITRDATKADDAVHSALLSVCLGSESLGNIVPYFIRSAQNAAKREWSRSRRFCPVVVEDPTWPVDRCIQDSIEQWNTTVWMEASAHDALCGLPAEERKVIEWYVWDGLSHAQIAAKLRISEPAARQRYSRARKMLQEKFYERCR